MFERLDTAGNGVLTLAEVDAVLCAQFPIMTHKGALVAGFRTSTDRRAHVEVHEDGTVRELVGDAWATQRDMGPLIRDVYVGPTLVRNLFL